MSAAGATESRPRQALQALQAVQQSLASAADVQIAQVVAMVDQLAERGEADQLLAPLRPRLMQLRPPRKLRLGRALYMPLDPLIVAAGDWRRGMLAFPRTLLPHLTRKIEEMLGDEAVALHAAAAGIAMDDEAGLLGLGRSLWPRAAAALAQARFTPQDIAAAGFAVADHAGLVAEIAGMLALAPQVQTLRAPMGTVQGAVMGAAPSRVQLAALLEAAASMGRTLFGLMTVLLLARFPQAKLVLEAIQSAAAADPARRQVAELALDATVGALDRQVSANDRAPPSVAAMSVEVDRVVALLEAFEQTATCHRPERQQSLVAVRRRFEAQCRIRFEAGVGADLLGAARRLPAEPTDQAVGTLEATARGLRRFEHAARGLGDPAAYAKLLREAAAQLSTGAEAPGGLRLCDKIRLVELLVGPEEALAMLSK